MERATPDRFEDGHPGSSSSEEAWPSLPLDSWRDTYATLHMWTQVVGKIRLGLAPMANHWWHVPLFVTSRGLTTSPIPQGTRTFEIDFDFIAHELRIQTSEGADRSLALEPRSVADFYRELMATLRGLGIDATIWTMPQEVDEPLPFETDELHASYDADAANRVWRILVQADRVMNAFRSRFLGKCSPVQFFWGAFDLAVTRFSGARAPEHPGGIPHLADRVVREAYSHEVSSCGFWPGGGSIQEPVFFSYAYPEPEGFADYPVRVDGASYNPEFREFILPYEAVRGASDPDELLSTFLQRTYEAAADLGGWDRALLERSELAPSRASLHGRR